MKTLSPVRTSEKMWGTLHILFWDYLYCIDMGPLFFAIALSIGNTVNILELYQTTETLENKEKQASIA